MGSCLATEGKGSKNDSFSAVECVPASSDSEISFLLLGSSDSGKSTILKQLKSLHTKKGFSNKEDLLYFRSHIHNNVLTFFKTALTQRGEDMNYITSSNPTDLIQEEELLRNVALDTRHSEGCSEELILPQALVDACKALWKDHPAIPMALLNRAKLGVEGDPIYFMDAIDRISADDYMPSEDDIMRCRAATIGVSQIHFQLGGASFTVIDVGGQRSQRRKWIHQFEDVSAILYVVSLSEYDQVLAEDGRTNRSKEARSVFKSVLKTRYLREAPIVLLLNKCDVLQEKIKTVSLESCFKDYTGGHDYEMAVAYFKDTYSELGNRYRPDASKKVYIHVTCALDKYQVDFVFKAAKDIVMSGVLFAGGMM